MDISCSQPITGGSGWDLLLGKNLQSINTFITFNKSDKPGDVFESTTQGFRWKKPAGWRIVIRKMH